MRLQVEHANTTRSIVISIDDDDATIADLARSLGLTENPLFVDDVGFDPSTRLADVAMFEGSVISHESSPRLEPPFVVGVVAGPDAGATAPLVDGANLIGRDAANQLTIDNPTVSVTHARLDARSGFGIADVGSRGGFGIADVGSRNGTWIGEVAVNGLHRFEAGDEIRLGSSRIVVRPTAATDRPLGIGRSHRDVNGRILVNRPPRGPVDPVADAVRVPAGRASRSSPVLSVVAVLAPLAMAGAMVAVLGSWRFAMFALMSPVMVLGNYLSGRRKVRRLRDGDSISYGADLERFTSELEAAVATERARRRGFAPDLLEVRRRIELPSTRLWERRLDADDALVVGLGRGSADWLPDLAFDGPPQVLDDDARSTFEEHGSIDDVELLVELRRGPLGILGPRDLRSAIARSVLLQTVCHHGPADLHVAILTRPERLESWSWAQWLPHITGPDGGVRLLAGQAVEEFSHGLLETVRHNDSAQTGWVLLVDDVEVLHGRSSPVRRLLESIDSNVFGVVLASTRDELPASIATVAQLVDDSGELGIDLVESGAERVSGIADLPSVSTAAELSRSLARFEDPEQRYVGGALPQSVAPSTLFGSEPITPGEVSRRWVGVSPPGTLSTPIGIGPNGVEFIDLVADGPHALVAGTTGSGKSEFLRTMVLGLALEHSPYDLVFVLIDYKGGSAFDQCARLPHVVGMVTDLDGHLAERALISLEAELKYRESILRSVEASDVITYRSLGSPAGPLPRLVVVIDEFATLRAELPEFVEAIVGIAQRGRSLGVHLVLATQRPSGAVDANIRANTNLRVALRVQDETDSLDVIDEKHAAHISRNVPGRAYLRRGSSDLLPVQTAYVSGPVRSTGTLLRVAPVLLGTGSPPVFADTASTSDQTNLELFVDAIGEAGLGFAPRRPWLDDLPQRFDPRDVESLDSIDRASLTLAVGDDPAGQRRVRCGWDPDSGPLLVHGALGSGVSTLLRSCVALLGSKSVKPDVWVYAVDHGAGGLAGLDAMPHVERVIEASEVRRHVRLLDMLVTWLDERREAGAADDAPLVVVVIDGLASFLETIDTDESGDAPLRFARIVRDGPAVGINMVLGAGPPGDVPRSITPLIRQRWVMELADPADYSTLGIRTRSLPTFRPGRVVIGAEALVAQVIDWQGEVELRPTVCLPPPVNELPTTVARSELGMVATVDAELSVPVGIGELSRGPVDLVLRSGEHALVVGPARSGRTTVLRTIAHQIRDSDPDVVLVWLSGGADTGPSNGLVDASGAVDELGEVLRTAPHDARRWVVLVDDADQLSEATVLVELLRSGSNRVSIIASSRSGAARSDYGHWLRHVRSTGVGLLLNPDNAVDGEILGVRLPRRERLVQVPGRGYLVHAGESQVVQIAL